MFFFCCFPPIAGWSLVVEPRHAGKLAITKPQAPLPCQIDSRLGGGRRQRRSWPPHWNRWYPSPDPPFFFGMPPQIPSWKRCGGSGFTRHTHVGPRSAFPKQIGVYPPWTRSHPRSRGWPTLPAAASWGMLEPGARDLLGTAVQDGFRLPENGAGSAGLSIGVGGPWTAPLETAEGDASRFALSDRRISCRTTTRWHAIRKPLRCRPRVLGRCRLLRSFFPFFCFFRLGLSDPGLFAFFLLLVRI